MNKVWVILITALVFLGSCSKDNKDDFTIKGSLSNLDAPYFFIAMESFDSVFVDTVWVDRQGTFSYKGMVDTLTMTSLYFDKKLWSTSVFLNKGWNVDVKGDINYPDLIKVDGGDVNDDLTTFKKANSELFKNRTDVLRKIEEAGNPEIKLNYSNELKNINFDLTNAAKDYIEKNPEKIASVVLIQDFYRNNTSIEQLQQSLSLLKGKAQSFYLADDLRDYSAKVKLSQVGSLAPDFEMKNGDKESNLNVYRGKYLYLTFATQNGGVYQNGLPAMMEVYKKLKNKDVEFVSVIVDSIIEEVPDSIKWPVFFDRKGWASKPIDLYNITELPFSVLISPEGRIIERGISAAILPEKIDELQKAKVKK